MAHSPSPHAADSRPLGALLEPALRQTCGGRLSEVNWFRTDWQRGGALTGYATYRDDDGQPQPVVVKLPPAAELVTLPAITFSVPTVWWKPPRSKTAVGPLIDNAPRAV
ncbi:MAG: hypothetical protein NTW19_09575 [Planctomycetota bacterium]|nr:hypothetical protein [Planctomycetota bacterium]